MYSMSAKFKLYASQFVAIIYKKALFIKRHWIILTFAVIIPVLAVFLAYMQINEHNPIDRFEVYGGIVPAGL